ncbi:MAG: hypothetical protein Tsb009_32740 [Planctomycetaceae bacterium]
MRKRFGWVAISCWTAMLGTSFGASIEKSTPARASQVYASIITADKPIAYWRFEEHVGSKRFINATGNQAFQGTVVGSVKTGQAGPRPEEYPLFPATNRAARFSGRNSYLRVTDPGVESPFDFTNGDSLTIEAWVNPRSLSNGSFLYILGKGRTGNPKFAPNNQNYALRLKTPNGALSFLFRSSGKLGGWHRWTSKSGVSSDDGWHHVAVTYTFGKKESIRGYIDGQPVKGVWDMEGATNRAPVVDNDEVRIGSGFDGLLDEVALYRTALSPKRIQARYRYVHQPLKPVDWRSVPKKKVLVEIFEGLSDKKSWKFRPPRYVESFTLPAFGFVNVPKKYNARGIVIDRSNPFLVRAFGEVTLPRGKQRILLRCRNAGRLYMDGRLIAQTAFHNISGSAHGKVIEKPTTLSPNLRPLRRGDTEQVAIVTGDGKPHRFRFEMIVGGRGHRPEFGDTSVSISPVNGEFHLLSDSLKVPFTNGGWEEYKHNQRTLLADMNSTRRKIAGRKETEYWNRRHQQARDWLDMTPEQAIPNVSKSMPVLNDIDRFIGAKLQAAGEKPAPLIDDMAFLRRATVDLIGTVPTPEQIADYLRDPPATRRSILINRLLKHPGWADNWVGYWQDVLAENPNIIKATLNNSGPFRWWIYESFLDNKPFDRFATELVRMEGSRWFGGPAGFEMAAQNDVPMAAKAQIIGRAFLGLNMTCARCHDAPFHDFKQEDLFKLAAMLKRGPQVVPKTSSIPGGDEAVKSLLVEVTLKPGSSVKPDWSFEKLISKSSLPADLRSQKDNREQLAALITSPKNQRFAQVIVNRLWKRYMGRGLVEPVDDWQNVKPSHPGLLDYLARELVRHNYDLKHVARLILNSHAYQRAARSEKGLPSEQPYLFASPILRRMSAEQIVDSLFSVAGKQFNAGQICIDVDGALLYKKSALNLGEPTRAWEFASLANERDRPSLSLPFARPFVTVLETFGWRSSRQNPVSARDEEPTVLQPAVMANSILSRRITRLSDDSAFTKLALETQSVERLVERIYLRMLTRKPTGSERKMFVNLLSEGYQSRRVKNPKPAPKPKPLPRGLVGWSNHLHPRANEIKVELQRAVEQGDPPTNRLTSDWRERLEDMIWTLMNSPEFVYLP